MEGNIRSFLGPEQSYPQPPGSLHLAGPWDWARLKTRGRKEREGPDFQPGHRICSAGSNGIQKPDQQLLGGSPAPLPGPCSVLFCPHTAAASPTPASAGLELGSPCYSCSRCGGGQMTQEDPRSGWNLGLGGFFQKLFAYTSVTTVWYFGYFQSRIMFNSKWILWVAGT